MMKNASWRLEYGATCAHDGTVRFQVWAPHVKKMAVRLVAPSLTVSMERDAAGRHSAAVRDLAPGARYFYLLDGERTRPDPVSRCQPEGVHGPSEVVDPTAFAWTGQSWQGLLLQKQIFYELHVGAFTPEGTFAALLEYLDYLKDALGITAIELMPIAEFPGTRNWGYDGVHLYAPHSAYGGSLGLKTLINACHEKGLGVVLDVVYNHLGPEGNYLSEYGPYFTDRYQTPWGQAVNFDGDESQEVRRYFIDNALYWVTEYHLDALRLDAIHGIFDESPKHILQELGEAVHRQAEALGRSILVIAESDLNDVKVISDIAKDGWGLDAQWSDDFHHAIHTLLTDERDGYYQDFGQLADLAKAISEGFVYQGQMSSHRKRPHGTSSRSLPGERFVICSQNHDQIGNRAQGDRLTTLVPFAALKLAAGLELLGAPNIPLLFMGEEYGETAPFLYFTSHTDPGLAQAVREGRRQEFAQFSWGREVPDPQDPDTFQRSLLQHQLREHERGQSLLRFYHDVIALRKRSPALHNCNKQNLALVALPEHKALIVHRWEPPDESILLISSLAPMPVSFAPPIPPGRWRLTLFSEAVPYGGPGQGDLPTIVEAEQTRSLKLTPFTFAVYRHEPE